MIGLLNFALFAWIIINNIEYMGFMYEKYILSMFIMIIVDFLMIYNCYIWIKWFFNDNTPNRENLVISVYINYIFTTLNCFVYLAVPWSLLFVIPELNVGVRIALCIMDCLISFTIYYYFLSMI